MTFRKPRSRILSSIFAIALLCAAGVVAQQPSGQTGQKGSAMNMGDMMKQCKAHCERTTAAIDQTRKDIDAAEQSNDPAKMRAALGSTALLTDESPQSTAKVTQRSVSIVSYADPVRRADRAALPLPGPVHTVTTELGVVPPGTFLVVRTSDTVSTRRAYRGTIYSATVAEDVMDQSEKVLIPKGSPIELTVRSFSFLGPGGVGMTELRLAARTVTVNGVRYPVETEDTREGLAAKRTGSGEAGQLMTRGDRINVPAGTLLTFRIEDPVRLRGDRQ